MDDLSNIFTMLCILFIYFANFISAHLWYNLKPFYDMSYGLIIVFLFSQFHMMLSEDGSGKGAALVAAVSHRLANE